MDTHLITEIINVPLIPVILLPVTGLALLVFYNRAAAINQRIRLIQAELRNLLIKTPIQQDERLNTMKKTLEAELKLLTLRNHIMGFSMICCLGAIFIFSLCALFVGLSLFYPWTINIALTFWFAGPLFVCCGTLAGIVELFYSFHSLNMQSILIRNWDEEPN